MNAFGRIWVDLFVSPGSLSGFFFWDKSTDHYSDLKVR